MRANVDINQANKARVQAYWQAMDEAAQNEVARVCETHLDTALVWNGPAPIGRCDRTALAESFWAPLKRAIPEMQRQTHLFLGGVSQGKANGGPDGRMWVCGTGYLTGRASGAFLGIPATGQSLRVRWAEFLCIEDDRIVEAQFQVDFIDWFDQIGLTVLPPPRGAAHVYPPPTGYDGVLANPHDTGETAETLRLGRDFIYGGLNKFAGDDLADMGMARFFHPNLKWYGPGGIGACLSLTEFEDLHQKPWLIAYPDRKVQDLDSLFAEGRLLAASGVAGVIGTHKGPYLDHSATGKVIRFSGLDFWLRDGNQLTENWVFVDMIDIFAQMGTDLFARMRAQATAKGYAA